MALGLAGPRAPGTRYGEPVVPNLNVRQICPNCRSDPPNIIEEYSKGDLVCADCGTILGDRIVDTRSEWRTFAGDEGGDDPSRVGDAGNPLLGMNQLETVISARDGRTGLSRDLQRASARGAAQRSNGQTSSARLEAVFTRIREMCALLALDGQAVQGAQHAFIIVNEQREVKPKNEKVVIAACISFASRAAGGSVRSLMEISTALGVTKKELGQALNLIRPIVQGKLSERTGTHSTSGIATMDSQVDGLISRAVNHLNLPISVYNTAKHIAHMAREKAEIDGRSYTSIASGVLYLTGMLMGKKVEAKEVAAYAGITDSTIKLVCKRIAIFIHVIVREEWKTQFAEGYQRLVKMGQAAREAGNGENGSARDRAQSTTPSVSGDAGTPISVMPSPKTEGDVKLTGPGGVGIVA